LLQSILSWLDFIKMDVFLKILTYFYPVYFLILLVFLVVLAKRSFPVFRESFKKIKLKDYFILFLLIFFGAILRIKYSFHIDLDPYGWRYIQDALAIKGFFCPFLKLPFELSDALHILGYPFLISVPLFFSSNILTISIFNIVFSVLTIGIVYLATYLWTQNKFASVLAGGMLAASLLHVSYSGMEFPMSISVFVVALEFLFFILWLKSKDRASGLVLITLFFISVNIKFENVIFILLFGLVFIKSLKDVKLKVQIKKNQKYFLILFILSVIICLPFFVNFQYLQVKSVPATQHLFTLGNFLRNFSLFIMERYKGFPLFMVLAFLALSLFKKNIYKGYILVWWFFISLISSSYCATVNSEWNMLQVLIPVFIISGYVISETINLFLKSNILRCILLVLLLFLFFWNTSVTMKANKRYSWINLKQDLNTSVGEGCIVSLNIRTSKFSLGFLFPDKNLIFMDDNYQNNKVSQCKGALYYFNPVPYGLEEEADKDVVLRWEDILSEKYEFKKVSNFSLYALKKK